MSTTTGEVRQAFGLVVETLRLGAWGRGIDSSDRAALLTADDLRMEEGSRTYGRPWRLYLLGPYGGHYTPAGLPEHLGRTREEARLSLRALHAGLRTGSGLRIENDAPDERDAAALAVIDQVREHEGAYVEAVEALVEELIELRRE